MSSTSYYRSPFGDTTYTKVFVGGLAWETQTDEMRRYFEQFGEILEAVIISDKTTGKSKGYGFVTFREAESATRAVADPNPMIDGRKANCNIASFGRPRPSPPRGRGQGGGPSQYQGGAQSGYTGIAAPAAQFMYQQYGFTYNPEYGYHQALYNAQLQQAHYYQHQQMYGGVISPSSSSLSSTIMPSPYYYGPRPYSHHQHHHQHQHPRLPSSLSPSASSSYLVYPNFENSSFAPPTDLPLISSSMELQEAAQEVREGGEMEAPESTSREMTSSPLSN